MLRDLFASACVRRQLEEARALAELWKARAETAQAAAEDLRKRWATCDQAKTAEIAQLRAVLRHSYFRNPKTGRMLPRGQRPGVPEIV